MRQRNPRIYKELDTELDKLCATFSVERPPLIVDIKDGGGSWGVFFKPSAVCGEPTIHVSCPDPYERIHTIRHEFTHYLDWLDGVRQARGTGHDRGFFHRLNNVEKIMREVAA